MFHTGYCINSSLQIATLTPSYKLPHIKIASVTALGMLKGAWRWLTDIVWLKDFTVEVQVSVDAVLGYILVLGISLVCIIVAGKQVQNLICGSQFYFITFFSLSGSSPSG